MQIAILYLRKKAERRVHGGHLWVYSNEVDTQKSPLNSFSPGQEIIVKDYTGNNIGKGYVNPHSLIAARILSYDVDIVFDVDFFAKRLQEALALRERLFAKPFYRLVYGESDSLPGLIVDRFADTLVVQLNTAGMEQKASIITAALQHIIKPTHILLRNDSSMRQLEGLAKSIDFTHGEPIAEAQVEENGVKFNALIQEGQKTGWFYDHRANRAKLRAYVPNKRVLDVFSYLGGWGIQAAVFGAEVVTCVDSSEKAIKQVKLNAQLNNVADKVTTICQDAFEGLNAFIKKGELYDVIILDPPAFIKRKKDMTEGQLAYRRINELALRLLKRDGILFSASCSMHLANTELIDILRRCARKLNRTIQILEQGHQAPDHPIHPAIAETEYLKLIVARVL
jgi:23S rRNA (cytosine1962-C5)-methyltransferase